MVRFVKECRFRGSRSVLREETTHVDKQNSEAKTNEFCMPCFSSETSFKLFLTAMLITHPMSLTHRR